MGTLFDYLAWRGDIPFSQVSVNEVDSLIFSLLSYVDYSNIVAEEHGGEPITLQTAANTFFARNPDLKKRPMGLIIPKDIYKLLRAAKECRRFKSVRMTAHVNCIDEKREMQFSATTFLLDTGEAVVAYRGTDDTIVGWKENFNMSFLDRVPAQEQAREYLNAAAERTTGGIYVTGHSKGGNLSIYAAIHCAPRVKERLLSIWCNDGPGFKREWLLDPDYLEIKSRTRTLLPQSSLVGMLLEHEENYAVVKSNQKGLWQHDGLSWEVQGSAFLRVKDVSTDSRRADLTLKNWIRELTLEQREQFCNALYQVLTSDNAFTLSDLVSPKNRWILRGIKMDADVRRVLLQTLRALLSARAKSKNDLVLEKKEKKQ